MTRRELYDTFRKRPTCQHLTLAEAKRQATRMGVAIGRTAWGDYLLRGRDASGMPYGYYSDSLQDILDTAKHITGKDGNP